MFLTDNFPPEVNAPASRTFDHCKEWVKKRAEVTVITCAPNFPKGQVYDGYKNALCSVEHIEGIKVISVWSYIVENKGFLKRTLDYISYSVTSFLAGLFVKTDIIIATSPQFFTALSGRTLAFWKRKPWIMEVRDLWPESIKTVGAMKDSIFIRYFEWQEMRCYHSAAKIVVVTDAFKDTLVRRGVDVKKIEVVKNGVDRSLFFPQEKDKELIKQLGLCGKRVIGYIGTHGMAHKLDFILLCAKKLECKTDYHFILMGNGAKREELLALKDKLNCRNVTMLESVPKQEVRRYVSILDICLINLRKSELFTTVIPSKIFENAAMGIPILMGVEGEAKQIVEKYHAGVCFEPENEKDFMSKLFQLEDVSFYESCKQGGLELAKDFDRKVLAERMYEIIKTQYDEENSISLRNSPIGHQDGSFGEGVSKNKERFDTAVCVTGQHREMLDQVLNIFGITPDYDLNIMKQGQDLYDVTARVLLGMRSVLEEAKPDVALVHGDTTTSTAALAAFYQQIPVGHVEAGLRTHHIYSPWPEEMNRQITGRIASFNFAPTKLSEKNLKEEKATGKIFVTGNTVIDALHMVVNKMKNDAVLAEEQKDALKSAGYDVDRLQAGRRLVLVTGHRRENFGEGFMRMCTAIRDIIAKYPNVDFVYPMHLNPNVRKPIHEVFGDDLSNLENMFFIEPLEYLSFIFLMEKANIVLTDSGGIQEEAPGLGKPVLVMRDTTERPEALDAGTVKLVGTDYDKIVREVSDLLNNEEAYNLMSRAVNPYGDGLACSRIVEALERS